jgi:hypothetical protein
VLEIYFSTDKEQQPHSNKCLLIGGGDCAAAHAGFALSSPVDATCKSCVYCLVTRASFCDHDECKSAGRRTFIYQCLANHVHIFPSLPGRWGEHAPMHCPHCGVLVDAALECKEAAELAGATTEKQRSEILREHIRSHVGGQRGVIPIMPQDAQFRAQSVLHTRMNVVSNIMAATFMKVDSKDWPSALDKRQRGNKVLKRARSEWFFPERKKKRSSVPVGNTARMLMLNPTVVPQMVMIFYPDATVKETAIVSRAAVSATNLHEENDRVLAASRQAEVAEARRESKKAKEKSAPPAPAPAPAKGKSKKRKNVDEDDVALPGGKAVDASEVAAYSKKRRATTSAAGTSTGPAPKAPIPKRVRTETDANKEGDDDAEGKEGDKIADAEDVEAGNDLGDELGDGEAMEELEEDIEVGGKSTAVEVWSTGIKYIDALFAPVEDDRPGTKSRIAYASKCGSAGKAWGEAINRHTSNRSAWQYVHRALAHAEEEALQHGGAEANDDSLLEKGNVSTVEIGRRMIFHAKHRGSGARIEQIRTFANKDGTITAKDETRTAMMSSMGQLMRVKRVRNEAQIRLEKVKQRKLEERKNAKEMKQVKTIRVKAERKAQRDATDASVNDAKLLKGGEDCAPPC